jgi:UDP-GlcNAc:undecaprenyl-phosphate GlcNAc-1-phosphate transferase
VSKYLVVAIFAAVVSWVLTPLVKVFAVKHGIVDRPRERRIHTQPVPLLGGFAMYAAFAAAALVFLKPDRNVVGLLTGGAIILGVGIIDDIYELKPLVKLMGQVVAAMVLVAFGVEIEFVTNPYGGMIYLGSLAAPLTILWVVAFVNVVNFIDGLDGLAAGVSAIAALTMAFVAAEKGQASIALMAIAVAGAAAGFLPHNFNPASIFMGDAGAMFLGFSIAGVSAMGALKRPATLALVIPVLVLGVPILDTAFAILRRLQKRAPVSVGDRDHVHHRLLARGMNQRQAVFTIYVVSVLLAAAACGIAVMDPRLGIGGVVTVFGALIFVGERSGILRTGPRHGHKVGR